MIPILTTSRLGSLLAAAGLLIPAVHGQAPPASVTEGILNLDTDIVVTPEADGSIALRVADAPPVEAITTLKAGDAVTPDAIAAAAFLQGIAPAKWQTGELYVFECWATWCGPCVGQIPHLNALHQKFKDKGLRVYGMNVWEDDRAKVEEFVKKKGDGKAIISFETMKACYTAAEDKAGALKYAEKLAAKYPEALPILCDGGVERLKAWIVEDMKDGTPGK